MAKDGTARGGQRPGAGRKSKALTEKLAAGNPGHRPLTVMDLPNGVDLDCVDMPEPSEYLKAKQRNGGEFAAEKIYKITWLWLKERGCEKLISQQLIEQYAISYDIYIGQLFEGYVRTGAMGWLLWGMCYYTLETGDRSYINMIRKGGDWMISRQVTDINDPRYGLMTGGIGAYNMEDYSYIDTDIEWCSVEHQCSGLQALEGCALVLKNEKYKKAAELVRDQLILKCFPS